MGVQISVSTSRHLPPGLHVPPNAAAHLIANGWQPPPNPQEPTGSFFLPKGGPMQLTRHQADLALRHYTAEYAERAKKDRSLFNDDALASLARELSWRIDADLATYDVALIVEYWTHLDKADGRGNVRHCEGVVNFTVNEALDNARVGTSKPHAHILRYSVPVSA